MRNRIDADKLTASNVQDLLTVCLARALDESLTSRVGQNWFLQLKEEEAGYDNVKKIIHDKTNVWELDFQALVKILYYRRTWSEQVLDHYGKGNCVTQAQPGAQVKESKFLRDLYSLMVDYRNALSAHTSAGSVNSKLTNKKDGSSEYYTYADAIHCMVRVAKVFDTVKDERGKSYYDQIVKLSEDQKKKSPSAAVIAAVCIVLAAAAIAAVFIITGKRSSGMVNESETANSVTAEETKAHEKNNEYYDENAKVPEKGKLTVKPYHVYWDKDGGLIAECYIINGYDYDVSNITIGKVTVSNADGVIASASFKKLEGFVLGSNKKADMPIGLNPDTVKAPGADLSDLTWDCEPVYDISEPSGSAE